MNSIPESFNKAVQELGAGRVPVAEQIVRQILQSAPNHFDSLHLLGFLLTQTSRYPEAVMRLRQAITLNPRFAPVHNILGMALKGQGQLEEAIRCHEQSLQLDPNDAGNLCNLGNALNAAGRSVEAIARFQQALRLEPNDGLLHNNLGTALKATGKLEEATICYRRALELDPNDIHALCNLGNALSAQGLLDAAIASYEQAVRIEPRFPVAHTNLGSVLQKRDDYDGAVACYRKAISLKPDHAEAHCNLGAALQKQNKLAESVASYQQALQCQPDYPAARHNLGTVLLQAGDFESGWLYYEDRIKVIPLKTFPQPQWDGSLLNGRRILVLAEQGLGDTLQFIRYAKLIKDSGGHVIFACPTALKTLLRGVQGIDEFVVFSPQKEATLPAFDVYLHLMSAPKVLGTTLASIPNDVPYLTANPDLIEQWKRKLGTDPSLKVGIAWQGNHLNPDDRSRSFRLKELEPIAQLKETRLYSLQKGEGSEQIHELAERMKVVDFTRQMDESTGPFVDTAAMMMNLDLVITSDTSVAHLAGALGIPVWVALSYSPDWRWMLDRQDSPWYPTMRLFRQPARGDWSSVFHAMADELRRFPGSAKEAPEAPQKHIDRVMVETSIGELGDKITILEIKSDRIQDPLKLANVRRELDSLQRTFAAVIASIPVDSLTSKALQEHLRQLKSVNESLWRIEEEIRGCERASDFGPRFIELARSVYQQNDRRAALKRQINELLGSRIVEEKSY